MVPFLIQVLLTPCYSDRQNSIKITYVTPLSATPGCRVSASKSLENKASPITKKESMAIQKVNIFQTKRTNVTFGGERGVSLPLIIFVAELYASVKCARAEPHNLRKFGNISI